jgi:hypothetical protein
MTDEQINEVMRRYGICAGSSSEWSVHEVGAGRKSLEAYLRTIGEPENTLPLNPNGSSKWAHLQKHNGAEAVGVVFRTGTGSVGSLVDGRVVWADWLAHPNGSKPESVNAELLEALKAAKAALKKVVEDCGGCEHEAGVCVCPELAAISKSGEAIAAAEAQQAGPENTRGNATAWLQWALHIIRERCPDVVGSHQFDWAGKALEAILADGLHCDVVPHLHRRDAEAIARAESAIETPAKVSPCAGHAVQLPDPLGLLSCTHPDCGRYEGPRSHECRAMADNACARPSICQGHAVQQEADASRDWPEDFPHENGQYMNTCHVCKNTFIGHKRRVVCKVCNNGFIRAQQEADEAGGA